ncbi:MAG: glycoside hydrolase family 38 C-terminal domain-containing protein, partial [Acutalibacteraceae bacterium]|nr:glycoside hydrolase family 38 C-terminal domain-containing protein [Acutalibacteraceae bacterium]
GMTAYVMMRPGVHENAEIPNMFMWESLDGTQIPTFHIPDASGYGSGNAEAINRSRDLAEKLINEEGHGMMIFYGVGNHGGGPTRGLIEYVQTQLKRDGYHDMVFSSPDAFFEAHCLEKVELPVWKDDLQHHASGCYSATSLVKQLNRKLENSLYFSEAFATVASKTASMRDRTEDFKEAWLDVCFNQFHDILCGCSIMEAYDDVNASMGHALTISDRIQNEAFLRIARRIDTWIDGVSDPVCEVRGHSCGKFPRPVVVFNPLSFPVKAPVRTYHPSKQVTDDAGNDVIFSNVRSSRSNDSHLDTVFIADVPAMGYAVYWLKSCWDENRDLPEIHIDTDVSASGFSMENEYLKVKFDEHTGFITSLVDKLGGYDYASADKPIAVPTVIDDHETDTWAHMVFRFHDIKGIMKLEKIELIENGNARAVIRTRHSFGGSYLVQDFLLASGQKVLRSKCKALWTEDFTLLKMSFPVGGENRINTYEIPGAYIKRPTNGEEEPAGRWGAISFDDGGRRTLAVVNDSKYSYDCPDNDLRLTVIRNVIFADHYSDRPAANFNFTDEGMQRFEYGIFVGDGEAEKSGIMNEAAKFNIRPMAVPESFHKGTLPQRKSYLSVDKDNIIMTAFKFCEDGSGDCIMRFYETRGEDTKAHIVCESFNADFEAEFGHNEIKTFRISKDGNVKETNFLEGIV